MDDPAIREAVKSGRLKEPFKPTEVNTSLGIDYAGVFLPKHRVGNGRTTELFIQTTHQPATYRLVRK